MLGDSGANLLGIILGFPLIYILSFTQKTFLFVLFLLLNILAEIYSFSEIISQNRPLRFVDRLGRN
jgi:ABC-type iron transport system FetAB permease component